MRCPLRAKNVAWNAQVEIALSICVITSRPFMRIGQYYFNSNFMHCIKSAVCDVRVRMKVQASHNLSILAIKFQDEYGAQSGVVWYLL